MRRILQWPLSILFIAGGLLLWRLDPEAGQRLAQTLEDGHHGPRASYHP